ncbi:YNL195C [Saccharomyces arboricola H-6]|uniref:YNL195C n=1 Tax=Saccharomyces arboricola (strain H-6 / AS 2.3317 / CBS 10644) TaxID=1160507 RepID=J8Q349_SACAR|nr:YNL195C [Saccharomyces arboricola H-6]
MLGLGQAAQAYSNNDDTDMDQANDKVAGIPGCGKANDLKYPHHDEHASSHQQHSGILPSECPGPFLNTGAGSIGIPGCGKATNEVFNDYDNTARSTLASFDVSKMTEARMNSKNVPAGCQDTSMPHFGGSMDQPIPGAGSPESKPHHIDAWNNVSSHGTDSNEQDMMHPQAAPLDRYNEHMVRDETFDNPTSSYAIHSRGTPTAIPSLTQKTEGNKNMEYGMNDQHAVPRNYTIGGTDCSTNQTSTADSNISDVKNEVLHN